MEYDIKHLINAVNNGYCGIVFRKYFNEYPKNKRDKFRKEANKLLEAIKKLLISRKLLEKSGENPQLLAKINEKLAFFKQNGLNLSINGIPETITLEKQDLSPVPIDIYLRNNDKTEELETVKPADELASLEDKEYSLSVKINKMGKRDELPPERKGRKMKTGGGYKMPAKDNKANRTVGGHIERDESLIAGRNWKLEVEHSPILLDT